MGVQSTLERYREIAPLGAGGMATVVVAEDTLLGRRVALKRLHWSAGDPRGRLRLRREALVGASLSHRNLVSIFDVIELDDGDAVIVMEYVQGETLRDTINREGRLAPREALRVLRGLASGLDAIHARRIVHRDVKPANVLLGVDGSVKLADLGIASVPDHTRITTAGTVLGSFRYMAPEQLKDGPATRAMDIYALAAVAFEVLSGWQARRESNALAVAHAVATQPAPDLRVAWPEAPAAAAELLVRGMCRDPAGRPASAGELVARLGAALEPEDTASISGTTPDQNMSLAGGQGASGEAKAGVGRASPRPNRSAASATGVGASAARSDIATNGQTRSTVMGPAPAAESRKTFRQRSGRGRVLAPLALLLVAGAVLIALLGDNGRSSSGAGDSSTTRTTATRPAASRRGTTSKRKAAATPSSGSTTASNGTTSTAQSTAGSASTSSSQTSSSPVAAVRSFYHLAAAHRYSDAWALADPTFRNQLGGYASFEAGQSGDRSITFNTARVTQQSTGAATVYVRTTSVRTDGTKHCSGTVQTVPGDTAGSWLVHMISISCA